MINELYVNIPIILLYLSNYENKSIKDESLKLFNYNLPDIKTICPKILTNNTKDDYKNKFK